MLDPRTLNLGSPDESILTIFKSRSFEVTLQLYQELTDEGYLTGTKTLEQDQEFRALFGGVTSDLSSIPLAISPLERLQLLTSAFRKAMATLSELKLRSLIQQQRVDLEGWMREGQGRGDGTRGRRGGRRVEEAGEKGKRGELAPALHILRIISSFHERAWVRGY